MEDFANNYIDLLSRKHEDFFNCDIEYKQTLAREILNNIQNEKWCYADTWMKKNAKLEKMGDFNSSKAKQLTAMMRFNMGSIAKLWLSTFLNNINITTTREVDYNTYICGPYSMGLNAPGIEFELYCEKDINVNAYQERCEKGTVSLILGAGNQNFLTLIDIFQRVFIFNECVLIKQHPLRQFLFEPYYQILKPLIDENILVIIDDFEIEFTKYLIKHPLVNHVHFTGSERTYQAIQKTLKGEVKDCNITAELGCITPWVVFPGEFSLKEIENIAKQIVNAKKTNGGSNCISPQVLILPENWSQTQLLEKKIISEIEKQQTVPCYYPNSIKNRKRMIDIYKDDAYIISSDNKSEMATDEDDMVIIDYGLSDF